MSSRATTAFPACTRTRRESPRAARATTAPSPWASTSEPPPRLLLRRALPQDVLEPRRERAPSGAVAALPAVLVRDERELLRFTSNSENDNFLRKLAVLSR